MSYEGYTEYRCACGSTDSADVYCQQPKSCRCGKPFTHSREVDCTNEPTHYGDWKPIKPAVPTDTPWGKIPHCRAHALEHPEEDAFMVQAIPCNQDAPGIPDSFCDRALGKPANDNRYSKLRAVLDAAYSHAAREKGEERHANGRAFEDQPMLTITRDVGLGFPLGQAMKKAQEAGGMADRGELVAAEKECLGAINYLAGAIIRLREMTATGERRAA